MKTFLKSTAFVTCLSILPTVSGAATITVSPQSGGLFSDTGSRNVTITETTLVPSGEGVAAGGFSVSGDLNGDTVAEDFIAWCVDIAHNLRLASLYDVSATGSGVGLNAAQVTNIDLLFETGYNAALLGLGTTVSKNYSAGFQLALWEIIYETTSLPFDVTTGNFVATNYGSTDSSGARGVANSLLAGLGDAFTNSYNLVFLESVGPVGSTTTSHYSQNLVTIAAVPLPAAGLMLLAGLGGLGMVRRRRRKTA